MPSAILFHLSDKRYREKQEFTDPKTAVGQVNDHSGVKKTYIRETETLSLLRNQYRFECNVFPVIKPKKYDAEPSMRKTARNTARTPIT